jgi:hypothetical protein
MSTLTLSAGQLCVFPSAVRTDTSYVFRTRSTPVTRSPDDSVARDRGAVLVVTDDRRSNQIRGFRRVRGICRVARSAGRDEERLAAFHAGGMGDRCPRPPPAGVRRDFTRLPGLCATPWPGGPPSAPWPCALTCAGLRNTAKHPQSATATARVIEFLLDDGPATNP